MVIGCRCRETHGCSSSAFHCSFELEDLCKVSLLALHVSLGTPQTTGYQETDLLALCTGSVEVSSLTEENIAWMGGGGVRSVAQNCKDGARKQCQHPGLPLLSVGSKYTFGKGTDPGQRSLGRV